MAPDPDNGRGPLPFRAILEKIGPGSPDLGASQRTDGTFDWEAAARADLSRQPSAGFSPTLIDAPKPPAFAGVGNLLAREWEESLLRRKQKAAMRNSKVVALPKPAPKPPRAPFRPGRAAKWALVGISVSAVVAAGWWALRVSPSPRRTKPYIPPTPSVSSAPATQPSHAAKKTTVKPALSVVPPAAETATTPPATPGAASPPTAGSDPRVSLFESARKAVDGFFLAETAEQRLQWQLSRRTPPAKMPAGRFGLKEVRHLLTGRDEFRGPTGPFVSEFRIVLENREGTIWLPFEHTPEGPRTDAAILTEQLDGALAKFGTHEAGEEATFRVVVSRQHSFERNGPDPDKFSCVKILPPNGEGEGLKAYFENGFLAADAIAKQLPWGRELHAVARLEWSAAGSSGATHPFVRLREIVRWGW